ncbi:zinc finger protein 1 isoform X2 [Patella vulgata]|uniref:zinc finger protein 1 isoform X2 n=1 Tax=Patella vulgata TaxID=6465 RepID=UPI0021800C01|nr:zinc finger protein 1 isoform X2 [Patella vulgata]
MAEQGRYGRRKQKNPRRKNENETSVNESTTVDKIAAAISRKQTNGLTDSIKDKHENIHDSKVETETNKAELMQQKENLSPKVKTCLGDSDETIKEFLARSDTAIIYPEPVSDQEDNTKDTEFMSVVDEEYQLKCIYCSECFTKPSVLRDHHRAQHSDQQIKFQCPKCNEAFDLKSVLDKHLSLHSPTSQICKTCNKTFANVYRLQRHMISHDESNDLRKFKCPECSKAFKFKHHLKEHIRIHSGEKPFECPNCSKRFSHSGSYSSHMTSKKCWAVNMKGRRVDRNGNNESSLYYRSPTTLNSTIPITQAPSYSPMIKYDPRSALPAYYSPPITTRIPTAHIPTTTTIMTYGLYSHNPYSTSVLAKALSAPTLDGLKTPHGKISSGSSMSQISPDVNSNTQLLNSCGEKKTRSAELEVKSKDDADDASRGAEANSPHESSKCAKMAESEMVGEDGKPLSITDLTCRFCHNCFKSPVELHQHERYLCKSNKDITLRISSSETSRNSPNSITSEASLRGTPNGSLNETCSEEDDADDEESHGPDGKKYRMRSLISDEQLAVLKTHYQLNPRPGKVELMKIATEIGFSKRVAQVWFQNMRARDRRRGKDVPYFPNMARFKHNDDIPTTTTTSSSSSLGYIPVVPQPFANFAPSITSTPVSKLNSHFMSKPITSSIKGNSQDEPLDLSVKKQPPAAHSGSSSPALSNKSYDDQVLNLSCKPSIIKDERPIKSECSIQGSAIFKYMQQEGLFRTSAPGEGSKPWLSHSSPTMLNSNKPSQSPASCTSSPPRPIKTEVSDNSESQVEEAGRLVIDETSPEKADVKTEVTSQMQFDPLEVNQNLDTLATVSLAALESEYDDDLESNKNKRQRKKSWRQVEAEEIAVEMDDSLSQEDDEPARKKRKSWKNHRVDLEVGMYACDQCDKLFSKQSSLARHKYEHSGARPFTCDVCPKSFKHKHHLTEHKRLHSGEKPFKCKKCNKRFSHSGSYSQHMNHRYKYCKPTDGDLD